MKTITNKEKAEEIAENNLKWYYEEGNSYDEFYQSAIEAMKWKDEQFAKQKADALFRLEVRLPEFIDYNGIKVSNKDFINDFKKAIEEL